MAPDRQKLGAAHERSEADAEARDDSGPATAMGAEQFPGGGIETVVITCVCATVWTGEEPECLFNLGSPANKERLGTAAAAGDLIWLQLALTDLSDTAAAWFEGSLSVWESVETPVLDWSDASPILESIGLTAPAELFSQHESAATSLLRVLPHVHGRGIFRAVKDVRPPNDLGAGLLVFPTTGFQPDEEPGVDCFWTIRTNVGKVRNVVISIRLPDHECRGVGKATSRTRSAVRELTIPQRFLSFNRPDGEDLAEAIAHHQAATARAVSEELRARLTAIERRFTGEEGQEHEEGSFREVGTRIAKRVVPPAEPNDRELVTDTGGELIEINEIVYQLERQVTRVLRRFGSYGDGPSEQPTFVPREIKLRYGYARDELHSLRDDCRLVGEIVSAEQSAREQEDRDRFQFVAALLASVILIPTLIAGLYGANVELPGDENEGFKALLLFVSGSAVLGFFVVNEVWARGGIPRGWLRRRRIRALFLVIALVILFGGVLELISS